jgi:transposase
MWWCTFSRKLTGADGQRLLTTLEAPEALQRLPEVELLRQVWQQPWVAGRDGAWQVRDPKALPAASQIIESPYEPEVRFATKRDLHGVGCTVHLTQTCDQDRPHRITHVATTVAPATDGGQLEPIQEALAARALLPAEHLVDAGYTRARNVVESRQRHHIDLVGPVDEDHQWQAKVAAGFSTARVQIDWDRQRATCPQGRQSIRCCETHTARKRTMIPIDFDAADCLPCPARGRCTRARTGTGARSRTLQSRAEWEALLACRVRQPEFAALYAARAGIEGTLSQGVRAFGLRQARYRGLAKTHRPDVPTATAIDLTRLADWLNEVPRAATRRSRFARLAVA